MPTRDVLLQKNHGASKCVQRSMKKYRILPVMIRIPTNIQKVRKNCKLIGLKPDRAHIPFLLLFTGTTF